MDGKIEFETGFFEKKCRENNLKLTPQRFAVYQELLNSRDHPNAEVIYRRLKKSYPNISLDTVNRTLLTFNRIGIANVVEGSGEPKRFDGNVDLHHHFRCVRCNNLIDFYNDTYDNLEVPEKIKGQFVVLGKKVYLEGICDRCKKR
jgi:Fur family peroxide stress response transcriptional regulator